MKLKLIFVFMMAYFHVMQSRLPNDIVIECMHGRLLIEDELVMAGALPCSPLIEVFAGSSSSSTSIVPPDYTAYAPFVIGFSDCEILQYIVKYVIIDFLPYLRPTTVNYLYVKYYTKHNGDFDDCDMGFYLDSTTNQFRGLIALTFADFTGSTMKNMIWKNAFLCGSKFESTILTNANFDGVIAPGIIFCYADLKGAHFHHAYMPQSFFNSITNSPQTNVDHCSFHQAVLFKTSFAHSKVRHVDFFNCDMDKVNLKYADCTGTDFNNSFGTLIVNTETNFTDASFKNTDRFYFDIPGEQSPIFNNTIMPDGSVCSGPKCVKYFKRLASELPSNGV